MTSRGGEALILTCKRGRAADRGPSNNIGQPRVGRRAEQTWTQSDRALRQR